MIQKLNQIIRKLETNSIKPMENAMAICKYLQESITDRKIITFYNWECPPRFLAVNKNGEHYISYDLDLQSIFEGKKLDQYTELPRVVENRDQEIAIINFLNSIGIKYRFVKLIADTNLSYITPDSINYEPKSQIDKKFNEFAELIAQKISLYPCETKVYRFSQLMEGSQEDYEKIYFQSIALLKSNPVQLIDQKYFAQQQDRSRRHMGLTDDQQVNQITIKTIATYAAEGIMLDLLSQTDIFSNCIWLNIEEVDQRTIEITNCQRKRKSIPNLPIIFPKFI